MTSNHSRYFVTTWRSAATVLLAALLSACAKGPLCPELGTCGGDPSGAWESHDNESPSCEDAPYFNSTTVTAPGAPFDSTLVGRPTPTAGTPQGPATLADWCSELVLQKDTLTQRSFLFQDPVISNFSFEYNPATMAYVAGFVRTIRGAQYYSNTCLTQFGMNWDDCPALQASITRTDDNGQLPNPMCAPVAGGGCDCAYTGATGPAHLSGPELTCKIVELIFNKQAVDETFQHVACLPNAARGGCDCGYDVQYPNGEVGVYQVDGNTITHHPQNTSIDHPSQLVFCRHGDTMDISGFDNTFLLNKAPVRTVHLHRKPPVQGTP